MVTPVANTAFRPTYRPHCRVIVSLASVHPYGERETLPSLTGGQSANRTWHERVQYSAACREAAPLLRVAVPRAATSSRSSNDTQNDRQRRHESTPVRESPGTSVPRFCYHCVTTEYPVKGPSRGQRPRGRGSRRYSVLSAIAGWALNARPAGTSVAPMAMIESATAASVRDAGSLGCSGRDAALRGRRICAPPGDPPSRIRGK